MMLSMLGWYNMGVPRCIQEDNVSKVATLLKDRSQVPQQDVFQVL
jgi:hypothetical protein